MSCNSNSPEKRAKSSNVAHLMVLRAQSHHLLCKAEQFQVYSFHIPQTTHISARKYSYLLTWLQSPLSWLINNGIPLFTATTTH